MADKLEQISEKLVSGQIEEVGKLTKEALSEGI